MSTPQESPLLKRKREANEASRDHEKKRSKKDKKDKKERRESTMQENDVQVASEPVLALSKSNGPPSSTTPSNGTAKPKNKKEQKAARRSLNADDGETELDSRSSKPEKAYSKPVELKQPLVNGAADLHTEKRGKKNRKDKHKDIGSTAETETEASSKPAGTSLKIEIADSKEAKEDPTVINGTAETYTERDGKKKRKKDRHQKTEGIASEVPIKVEQSLVNGTVKTGPEGKKRPEDKTVKKPILEDPEWSLSTPIGGFFSAHDPVFTPDEKYILLANARTLRLYSTSTSLLERDLLPTSGSNAITSYALSPSKPDRVYAAGSSGIIYRLELKEGHKPVRWHVGSQISAIAAVCPEGSTRDYVFASERREDRQVINVHSLRSGTEGSKSAVKQIISREIENRILSFKVIFQGEIVVVACKKTMAIGKRSSTPWDSLQELKYTWWEFPVNQRISCFDVYERSSTDDKTSKNQPHNIDLAIGNDAGKIFVYEDILSRLQQLGKRARTTQESLTPRILHWHRERVGSVKWSRDGNYLISGGNETVLIIWQLATGQRQELPHLTAAIQNIVVSPKGASYALCLANNSIIVLSTTELEPKTSITGLQSRRIDIASLHPEKLSARDASVFDVFRRLPVVVNPADTNRILLPVPSSQPRVETGTWKLPEPYLETFDLATEHHVTRQALTRTNVTDFHIGPNQQRILEPDVRHLQISNDGKWLASIDEWIPPRSDLEYADEGDQDNDAAERSLRREVYLKLWLWDETLNSWKLDARIDGPHIIQDVGTPMRVFDMVSDPTGNGFATVGEDQYVRIWRAKTRTRSGVTVRGSDGQGLVTWSMHRQAKLPDSLDLLDPESSSSAHMPVNGCLAFSTDGSVLAVSLSWPSAQYALVHLVDTASGSVRHTISALQIMRISSIAFLGRYLIIVGDSIIVWDIVADELAYTVPFWEPKIEPAHWVSMLRLAVNEHDGTFAVCCPLLGINEDANTEGGDSYIAGAQSRIVIFEPTRLEPLGSVTAPAIVLSLIATKNDKGYIALDSAGGIRTIKHKASPVKFISGSAVVDAVVQPTAAHEDAEMKVESDDVDEINTPQGLSSSIAQIGDVLQDAENDKPVVRPEQLQQIFDNGHSFALAPVKDLFGAVVGLYARKPRRVETRDVVMSS